MEQPIGAALLERISWDDLRVFVAVARTLSFRKAATALRTSTPTVMRCVERLEKIFEFRLFDRLHDGLGLTEKGQRVYQSAQEMERASLFAARSSRSGSQFTWFGPLLGDRGSRYILDFAAAPSVHPRPSRNHHRPPLRDGGRGCACAWKPMSRFSSKNPADRTPKSVRLGRLHIYPFASRQYIDTYGMPTRLDQVKQHRLVHQKAAQVEDDAYARMLRYYECRGDRRVAHRTRAQRLGYAIELGLGIGPLPTYIVGLGSDLIPIDIELRHPVDIWMTYPSRCPCAATRRRFSSTG